MCSEDFHSEEQVQKLCPVLTITLIVAKFLKKGKIFKGFYELLYN